jgi:hypothetical protein
MLLHRLGQEERPGASQVSGDQGLSRGHSWEPTHGGIAALEWPRENPKVEEEPQLLLSLTAG